MANQTRHSISMGALLALVVLSSTAEARVDPLRVITERMVRAEILLVLDTSGSMAWHPSPAYVSGSDCAGKRTDTVDICGDGMCSGVENGSSGSCPVDCRASSSTSSTPGDVPMCDSKRPYVSRMVQLKRVLGNLLPDMRRTAGFGMVTFKQSGYFRYYRGKAKSYHKVTVYLSQTEMRQLGAWDETANRPAASFAREGVTYTLLSQTRLGVKRDSLYARTEDLSQENRFAWSKAKRLYNDGIDSWTYKGSYYTFNQHAINSEKSTISKSYRGPQYIDSRGRIWVYHRFNQQYAGQGISSGADGLVVENISISQEPAEQDASMYRIVSRLNTAKNGGLWAWGGTPTSKAIQVAERHFLQRQNGSGVFYGQGPDPAASCRPRYVLLLTDGQPNRGYDPRGEVQALYRNSAWRHNPVKTLVVGLPGLPSSAINVLDVVADLGDDGLQNNSRSAFYASDETTLLRVIKEALFEMVRGDYTTSSPGASTSAGARVSDDLALVASTQYPGWRGQLRAMDLTHQPPRELWNAGTRLMLTPYNQRRIYTGLPGSNRRNPVPLFDKNGAVNLDGGCAGCGPVGLRQVWSALGQAPGDHQLRQVAQWLAGKGNPWKLGPILRSTPATVGSPPELHVWGHDTFRKARANRERLIYITSNDGILHAFRANDGSEAFAYVPPNLLSAIHRLWLQGGQDTDPNAFRWILAGSPRVEDMPPSRTLNRWSTQLALSMGPGGEDFVVLDISNPSTCDALHCEINDPPFSVLSHSSDLSTGPWHGQTWSTPVMFYTSKGQLDPASGHMAMGSGYGQNDEGQHYTYFPSIFDAPRVRRHPEQGAQVDYAVLADTTAAVDSPLTKKIIATYQADLNGRVVRHDRGDTASASTIINADPKNPIYYAPAAMHLGQSKVLVAAASQAKDELAPPAEAQSTLYLRLDDRGQVDPTEHRLSCTVSDICSGRSGCPLTVPKSCTAPSPRARPVGSPVIIDNEIGSGKTQAEVFYLVYDPPTGPCELGTTWLIRIATDSAGQRLLSSVPYAGVRSTGLNLIGGGRDLVITQIGTSGQNATAFSITGLTRAAATTNAAPYIEVWREVR